MNTRYIYVLLCEDNKYFIGTTNNFVELEFLEHLKGNVCEWTIKYKPKKIVSVFINPQITNEFLLARIYMKNYGIDNVRSSNFNNIEIPNESKIEIINSFINTGCEFYDMINIKTTENNEKKIKNHSNCKSNLNSIEKSIIEIKKHLNNFPTHKKNRLYKIDINKNFNKYNYNNIKKSNQIYNKNA